MSQEEDETGEDSTSNTLPPELARLYVAGIPKSMNEAQLKPLFDQWGSVRDLMILRERSSGLSRGCAFVGYDKVEEAEAAIQHLDRRVHLPGAMAALEVRFARDRHHPAADDVRQIFFSGAPPSATEADVQALFGSHGVVESVTLMQGLEGQDSPSCGLVTMASRHEAAAAVEALDGKALMEGATAPLTVKFAETDAGVSRRTSRASGDGGGDDTDERTVFFARVLRSATEEAVHALFSRFGRVADINLFRAFQGAPTTKGCGLVTMASIEGAAAAIAGLHEQHVWPGMAQPMVVRWMDSALQRRRREEHLIGRQAAALAQAAAASVAAPPVVPPAVWATQAAAGLLPQALAAPAVPSPLGAAGVGMTAGLLAAHGGGLDPLMSYAGVPTEVPPPGCAPDAYKLFIGNVPACYSERDLRPLFESVGPVVELVVLYDKQTGASKGSAFCWYATRADADRAAVQFNERHLLPDPTGHQQRPLVVRPATVRRAVPRALLMPQRAGGGMLAPGLGGADVLGVMGGLPGASAGARLQQQAAAAGFLPRGGAAPGLGGAPQMLVPHFGGGIRSSGGGGLSSSSFILDNATAFGGAGAGDPGDVGIASGNYGLGPSGGGGGDGVTIQVPLLAGQLSAVTPHVFSIQSASGADVSTHAVAPGVFCLRVSGPKVAVDAASQLISSIVQGAG